MKFDIRLYNATVVGENPGGTFMADGNKLHAIEEHVAQLKKEACSPETVNPLLREALKGLIEYSNGKSHSESSNIDLNQISLKPTEKDQLIEKIVHMYSHLSHHNRMELSTLIHHKL